MDLSASLDLLRLTTGCLQKTIKQSTRKTGRIKGRFLKGPVPLDWLAMASRLPGRALAVAIIIHYLSGLKKSPTVQFSQAVAREFGVERNAAYRGLAALETAGLIRAKRHPGRCTTVTIIKEP